MGRNISYSTRDAVAAAGSQIDINEHSMRLISDTEDNLLPVS